MPGGDAFDPGQNLGAAESGSRQITITRRSDPSIPGGVYWEARNAITGEVVWPFAHQTRGVQELNLPVSWIGCGDGYFGTFGWNPTNNADAFKTFTIANREPNTSRASARAHAVGIRRVLTASIPGPAPGATIGGQVVSTQTVAGTTASFAWNTTTYANGAHTLALTARDATGQTATTGHSVNVSNGSTVAACTASISCPDEGQVVSGDQTVGMSTTAPWGQTKTFTLAVDETVILRQTVTGTTLWWTWKTRLIANGTRVLGLTVADSQNRSATARRTVTVRNSGVTRALDAGPAWTDARRIP